MVLYWRRMSLIRSARGAAPSGRKSFIFLGSFPSVNPQFAGGVVGRAEDRPQQPRSRSSFADSLQNPLQSLGCGVQTMVKGDEQLVVFFGGAYGDANSAGETHPGERADDDALTQKIVV